MIDDVTKSVNAIKYLGMQKITIIIIKLLLIIIIIYIYKTEYVCVFHSTEFIF